LTADIDIAETIAEYSSETVEAAHLSALADRMVRQISRKFRFFAIGKVFSDFAESRERDGADQGALPLTNGNAQ
jgi:hypothetical protein